MNIGRVAGHLRREVGKFFELFLQSRNEKNRRQPEAASSGFTVSQRVLGRRQRWLL